MIVSLLLAATVATVGAVPPVESRVEAGWTARFADSGEPLAVTGTITVPRVRCAGRPDAAVVTSIGVVEVPYRFAGGRVYARCDDGRATYEARLETSTGASVPVDGAVRAGDRIKVAAVWDGSVSLPHVDVQMISDRRGWAVGAAFDFVADGFNGAVFRQTPLWGDGDELPIPAFTGAKITRAHVDGDPLGRREPTRAALVDADGDRVVTPTGLRGGTAFTLRHAG